ncbi:cryptochrome/photolyase family protein [Psychrobacter sp. FDAARGOS_221]|uniref:cryptochrome/photolyase family protein n=1 Tax=Psychrobacter sp. FDAARGOS_221 TaxID=1975705 RepID=UPI000BB53FE2|nr:FAD-binding domain-containing protein [Psychrobacter sp. FDAARGOS_221]PNK61497.1 deoxyribodipyrimidine photolyase [Psychrobacter sp. FDAARGOS_221]
MTTKTALKTTTENSSINALMWFRRDLRIDDNTALTLLHDLVSQTAQNHQLNPHEQEEVNSSPARLSAIFVVTPEQWLQHDMSLVQMDLMLRTLKQLAIRLSTLNIKLQLIHCDTFEQSVERITEYCLANNITHVAANAEYEINERMRDDQIAKQLSAQGIQFDLHHDQCIVPPGSVMVTSKTGENKMYQVFTPFYKRWQSLLDASPVHLYDIEQSADSQTQASDECNEPSDTLAQIDQLHQQMLRLFLERHSSNTNQSQLQACHKAYPAGEWAAQQKLNDFVKQDIDEYQISREQPALMATSQLSAYLAIGAISARQCYVTAIDALARTDSSSEDILTWVKELAWRDFYRHVIVDRPDIVKHHAYKKETDNKINWSYDLNDFKAWCEGMTGVPLVDAAMRCLNQTGFMHNRLRMVTAMFLTKDLLIDWRWGERYFMQQLIDGDFASNNGGWQWSASIGTDAAPYFRIMNPFSQGKTHDKEALFIKTWLPELKDIPAKILHDESKLRQALSPQGDFADVNYPQPMVEHKTARLYAIEQFKSNG